MGIFSQNKIQSDFNIILFLILENIKILFLIEPILMFRTLRQLSNKRSAIMALFNYIGEIDSVISIATLRNNIPYYCIPKIKAETTFKFKNIYHPLIENCIPNTIDTNKNSILITGSNMSGKTTLLRTIAINTLLAQTINTCFAESFELSPMRIFSAIRISDDLFSGKSYYLEEVSTIKKMLDVSEQHNNLFLLDEIYKGTNTIERIASGAATLSYLTNNGCNIVIVSTHDMEMIEFLKGSFNFHYFSNTIKDNNICFDYKLKKGYISSTNAIRILELYSYLEEITSNARKFQNYYDRLKQISNYRYKTETFHFSFSSSILTLLTWRNHFIYFISLSLLLCFAYEFYFCTIRNNRLC
jgi:DNA mismatch repair ATPase MutS